jgi:uncharacterized protein (TIGR04552 family)
MKRASTPSLPARLSTVDIEAVRLLLSGSSVIDWRRLAFRDAAEVGEFLRVHEFRPDFEGDRARLWALHAAAIQYLELSFQLQFPRTLLHPPSVEDLFLFAGGRNADAEVQRGACSVLKVMHIVHHLDARELGFLVPMSDRELFALAEEKVLSAVERMKREGYRIVEAAVSRKLKDSLVTKLLAKRENIAAQIFDKIRVRIITSGEEDLLPVLQYLVRHVLPFNYAIPRQSRNRIVDLRQALVRLPLADEVQAALQEGVGLERGERPQEEPANEFSGATYRDITFVVDLPLRVPSHLWAELGPAERALGPIVFTLVEFQVLDEATHLANERGDGSHEAYKRRQLERVFGRISGERPEA